MNDQIISALVGLVGACSNNGKTVNTDGIVMDAMLSINSESDTDLIVSKIKQEKFTISPNCATCPTPCGNTSDYDMTKFYDNQELKPTKEALLSEAVLLTKRLKEANKTKIPDAIYRAVSFFSYELSIASYEELINILKNM